VKEGNVAARNLSASETARNLSHYLNRVANHREGFVIFRRKKPVAELRPVSFGRRLGDLPAILSSLPSLSEDEAKAFAQDMAAARAEDESSR
jgi:antitoxin (DNA-binding transcriptional repressor) of toxin-antitoxin stability system